MTWDYKWSRDGKKIIINDGDIVVDADDRDEDKALALAKLILVVPEMVAAIRACEAYLQNCTHIEIEVGGKAPLPDTKEILEAAKRWEDA